jgi:hypothetical protein
MLSIVGQTVSEAHGDGLLNKDLLHDIQVIAEAKNDNPEAAANNEMMMLISRVVQKYCNALNPLQDLVFVNGPFVAAFLLGTDFASACEAKMVQESVSMQKLKAALNSELHLFVFNDGSAGNGSAPGTHWAALAYITVVPRRIALLVNTDTNVAQTKRVAAIAKKLLIQIERGLSPAAAAADQNGAQSTKLVMFQPEDAICSENSGTLCGYQLGSAIMELAALKLKVNVDSQQGDEASKCHRFITEVESWALHNKRPQMEGSVLKDYIAKGLGSPSRP